MTLKKTLISGAVVAVLGVGSTVANADTVTSMQLGNYDGDTLQSDFNFYTPPTGDSANKFGANGELCGGSACAPIAFDSGPIGNNVFTTGFNYGGTGVFTPNTFGAMSADITGGVLTFSSLDFGGEFGGVQFDLPPDGGPGNVTVADVTDLGGGDFGVIFTWTGTVVGGTFDGFPANWRLEGTMSTGGVAPVPIPAAAWLFGSGLVGLVGVARRRKTQAL